LPSRLTTNLSSLNINRYSLNARASALHVAGG